MRCGYPVNRTFYFSAVRAVAAAGRRIVSTMDHCHIAVLILLKAVAGHKICIHQAHFIAREHAEILFRWLLHEVFAFDIEFSRKRNLTYAERLILQIVHNVQILGLSFRIVVNHNLHRIKNCHHTGLLHLEILADAVL